MITIWKHKQSIGHTSSAVGLLYGSTARRREIKSFADEDMVLHVWSSKLKSPWMDSKNRNN